MISYTLLQNYNLFPYRLFFLEDIFSESGRISDSKKLSDIRYPVILQSIASLIIIAIILILITIYIVLSINIYIWQPKMALLKCQKFFYFSI